MKFLKLKDISFKIKEQLPLSQAREPRMSHKVNFRDFDVSKIIFGKTEEKTSTQGKQQIKYYVIPIQYMYDVKAPNGSIHQIRGDLMIEGPEEISRGPQSKSFAEDEGSDKPTKVVHSILTKYDLSNPDHYDYVNLNNGTIQRLFDACVKHVYLNRSSVNIKGTEEVLRGMFWYPCIKWKKDDDDQPVPGVNPAGIWKLFRYGKENYVRETTFTLPIDGKGRVIPWDAISKNNIKHCPLIKVNNITIASGRPSLKMDVYSSVVIDILPGEGPSAQEETVQKYSGDATVVANLFEKLKAMEAENAALRGMANLNIQAGAGSPTPATPTAIPGVVARPPSPEPTPVPEPTPAPISLKDLVTTQPTVVEAPPPLVIPGLPAGIKLPPPLP